MGDEAEPFLASLDEPPQPGLRVNTLKATAEEFRQRSPFALRPVPWCAEGFLLPPTDETHPDDIPTMPPDSTTCKTPAPCWPRSCSTPNRATCARPVRRPGGKATHLAARLGHQGLLVANEVVRGRTAALVENLERFGAANILITESPETLAATWPAAFDPVLVDAPCSGEGMFRKTPVLARSGDRRQWRAAPCARPASWSRGAAGSSRRPPGLRHLHLRS